MGLQDLVADDFVLPLGGQQYHGRNDGQDHQDAAEQQSAVPGVKIRFKPNTIAPKKIHPTAPYFTAERAVSLVVPGALRNM